MVNDMVFRMGKVGPLVIVGLSIYIAVHFAQTRAAVSLCERYSVGTRINDWKNLEGSFFLTPMGHYDPKLPRVQNLIFCASATMCDVSCSLEIENGLVTKSEHNTL